MAHSDGVYRTRDSLKNFHLRVELRKLTTSKALSRGTDQLVSSGMSTAGQQDAETWVFCWQEKVFSQFEEEVYSDENNCVTPLQNQYHQSIRQLRSEGGRPNCRLFSYVDNDHFQTPVNELHSRLTDCPSAEDKTFVSQHAGFVRRRHRTRRTDRNFPSAREESPVLDRPSEEQRLSSRIVTPSTQAMYLMADIRRMDGEDSSEEHVLCHITVNSHGVVTLSPDFNTGRPAYRIENRHHEVFEYQLEPASEQISDEQRIKERKIVSELYCRHADNLQSCVGGNFIDPPESNALRVVIFGEIVSAFGFEYNDLYVTCHLELPEFWLLESGPTSPVVTQISRTQSHHQCSVAHLNCPVNYELHFHNPDQDEDGLPSWPRFILEVSSLDCWDRHRVEGYGYLDLPSSAGRHTVTVPTWRACGSRVVDKMRRFFVGGAPEMNDVSFVAQPRDFQGTHLSRYGFRTETSGKVKLSFNIIHQSSAMLEQSQASELAQSLKYKGFKSSVAAALGELSDT